MAGIGGTTYGSPAGALANFGSLGRGQAVNVSNASRGVPGQSRWTTPGTMTPQQSMMYGQGDINRGMMEGQQGYDRSVMEQKRGWQLEDQNTSYQRALELMSGMGGGGGGGGDRVTGDDSGWDASYAASMGKAKDASAAAVGAARKSLMGNMTQRGISGSGIEAKLDQGIQLAGAGQIGAAGRDLATQSAARHAAVSDRNYAGNIQQRGQDITAQGQKLSLMPSLFGLLRAGASY